MSVLGGARILIGSCGLVVVALCICYQKRILVIFVEDWATIVSNSILEIKEYIVHAILNMTIWRKKWIHQRASHNLNLIEQKLWILNTLCLLVFESDPWTVRFHKKNSNKNQITKIIDCFTNFCDCTFVKTNLPILNSSTRSQEVGFLFTHRI